MTYPAQSLENQPPIVISGAAAGHVTLRVEQGLLWVTLTEEPTGTDLLACFKRAEADGWLQLQKRTLVDLTRFTGTVDWSALHAIKQMTAARAGQGIQDRVAYLARNYLLRMVVNVVCFLFPRTQHRLFLDQAEAIAWLQSLPESQPAPLQTKPV
jgi:hypothetical protein